MTKARTAGAKRRARAAQGGIRTLYAKFSRQAAQPTSEPPVDPLEAPAQARANRVGNLPRRELLDPSLETEAGKALWVGVKDATERRELFELFMAYDKAVNIYYLRILGRARFPAVSKLEYMPERLETRADDRPDLRTEAQKIDAARRDMAHWDGLLDRLHPHRARIIRNAHNETFVRAGELTGAGRSFIAAMRALQDVVGGG